MTTRRAATLCFYFSLAGLGLAGYLSFIHLSLLRGELIGVPLCGGAGSLFNCHAVAASRFGRIYGVPVAFWGVLGYLVLLAVSFVAWKFSDLRRQALTLAAGLSGAFLLLDAGLLWTMVVKIRALCLLCLAMYGIKALILLTVKRSLGKRWKELFKPTISFWLGLQSPVAPAAGWLIAWVAAAGLAGILSVHATSQYFARAPGSLQERIIQRMRTGERVAVEAGDSPRFGSPSTTVQVVMFSDPLCPLCREAAEFNEISLKAHRGKLSVVTKQFPLDSEALRACLAAGHPRERVMKEIEEGKRLGVTATPTFFVNGVKILGAITPAQFDEIIREEENRPVSKPQEKL